jgi:hypothetical protein
MPTPRWILAAREPFPTRGEAAGGEPWEVADRADEAAERAELEEAQRRLEAAVLRQRRRLAQERLRALRHRKVRG